MWHRFTCFLESYSYRERSKLTRDAQSDFLLSALDHANSLVPPTLVAKTKKCLYLSVAKGGGIILDLIIPLVKDVDVEVPMTGEPVHLVAWAHGGA